MDADTNFLLALRIAWASRQAQSSITLDTGTSVNSAWIIRAAPGNATLPYNGKIMLTVSKKNGFSGANTCGARLSYKFGPLSSPLIGFFHVLASKIG
jgi:hypothetical protein